LPVEGVAVGAAAVFAEGGDHAAGVELQDAAVLDVAEEDVAVGVDRGAFQKAEARGEGDFGFGGEERGGQGRFGEIGHVGGDSEGGEQQEQRRGSA